MEGVQDGGRAAVLEQLRHAGERVGGARGAQAVQGQARRPAVAASRRPLALTPSARHGSALHPAAHRQLAVHRHHPGACEASVASSRRARHCLARAGARRPGGEARGAGEDVEDGGRGARGVRVAAARDGDSAVDVVEGGGAPADEGHPVHGRHGERA